MRNRSLLCALLALFLAVGTMPPTPAAADPGVTPASGASLVEVPVLRWPAVPRTTSYAVQMARTDTFSAPVYSKTVQGNAATPEADLVPGAYWWRFQAKGLDGTAGPWSGPYAFTMLDDDGPALIAPEDGAALAYPDQAPVLAWAPVAGVKAYEVQFGTSPTFVGAASTRTSNTSLVPTTLLTNNPESPTYWRVRGITTTATASYTKWSTPRRFSISWGASRAPALLSPTNGAQVSIPEFVWEAVPGAVKYELWVAMDENFTNLVEKRTVVGTRYVPQFTYTAKGHYWRVRAVDPSGSGAYSVGPFSATHQFSRDWLTPEGQVARPDDLRVDGITSTLCAAGGSATCTTFATPLNKVLLAWEPVVGASHYEVQLHKDPSFNGTFVQCKAVRNRLSTVIAGGSLDTSALSACSWIKSGPALVPALAGTDLYVRIRAVAAGTGSAEIYSAWSNQMTADGRPGQLLHLQMQEPDLTGAVGTMADNAPAVLLAPAPGATSQDFPVLRWAPVEGAGAYLIRIAKDANFTNPALKYLSATQADYYVTAGTSFVPPESFRDNTAGAAYYWYVLPCSSFSSWSSKACPVGDHEAINIEGRWSYFKKQAPPLSGATTATVEGADGRWVKLSWDELGESNPEATATRHYELEVTSGTLDGSVDLTTDSPSVVLSEAAYTPGAQYKWRVRAVDGGSVTGPWTSVDAGSGTGIFTAPMGSGPDVTSLATSSPTPRLAWEPQAGPATYEVQVFSGTNPDFPDSAQVLGGATGTPTPYAAYAIPTWLPAGSYSWRVRSKDANGVRSSWTARTAGGALSTFQVSAPAPSLTAPLHGASVALDDLVLTWGPVAQAVKYRVEVLSADGLAVLHKADVVGTSYAPAVPLAAGQYHWQVTAMVGESAALELARSGRRPMTVTSLPDMPRSARATVLPEAGSLSVAWSAPAGGGLPITSYVLRYRADSGPWAEQVVSSTTLMTALGGLSPATTYTVQVAAANANGLGPWTPAMTARTASVPSAVSSLVVSSVSTGLKVTWRPPSATGGAPLTGYRVEVRRTGTGDGGWTGSDLAAVTTTTLTGLSPSSTYEVRAAARNGIGLGPWSQYSTAVTPGSSSSPSPTPSPSGGAGASTVVLAASPPSGALGRTVTLTATVEPATAVGTVSFSDSGHVLGKATVSGGRAVLITTGIYGGTQQVRATYSGSSSLAGGTSAPVTVTSTDRTKPKRPKVSITGRASAPTVTWTARDSGGLRYAEIRTKFKGGKTTAKRVPAAPSSWKGAAARKGTYCAWVKVQDWSGNWSKTKKKCTKLK